MKFVLVACEESQEVCKAFRALGAAAFSCDLQVCSGGHPEWHILDDALLLLNGGLFTTDRAKNRSKTFPGIAAAMASQWLPLL